MGDELDSFSCFHLLRRYWHVLVDRARSLDCASGKLIVQLTLSGSAPLGMTGRFCEHGMTRLPPFGFAHGAACCRDCRGMTGWLF